MSNHKLYGMNNYMLNRINTSTHYKYSNSKNHPKFKLTREDIRGISMIQSEILSQRSTRLTRTLAGIEIKMVAETPNRQVTVLKERFSTVKPETSISKSKSSNVSVHNERYWRKVLRRRNQTLSHLLDLQYWEERSRGLEVLGSWCSWQVCSVSSEHSLG